MLKLLLDQDFDHRIIRELIKRIPDLDFTTALELGLSRSHDRSLLLAAAEKGRILLSHDEASMPGHYFDLLNRGEQLEGAIIVPRRLALRNAIDELELVIQCTRQEEWTNIYKVLPF